MEKAYNIVIPTKNLSELTKMLGDDDNNIEIHLFENRIMFKFNSIILISSLINGSYPDVTKLIPTDFSLIVNVKLRELISAIGRASLFTNESDRNTISFETKGEEATIMSNIPEKGRANETLKISKNNEEDLKIAFSSKYMLDALKTLDCDDVTLMFNGNVKPIIIKNPNNNDILQLVLPIRV